MYETGQRQTSQHIQFLHETTKPLLKLGTARKADSSMTYARQCKVQNSQKKVMLLSFHNAWLNVRITLIYGCTCGTLILEYMLGVFTGGKPWLQTCPVTLPSLLQESQFWLLPGHAWPTNDSDYMSMSLFVSIREFMCVLAWRGKVFLQTIFTLFLMCPSDNEQY